MTEPISDPAYWARRLRNVQEADLHMSVFKCPPDRWRRIEARHRAILAEHVRPSESVLDAGCGYGRLPTLLPDGWFGDYLGVDLCPDFIDLARKTHPLRRFMVCDLRELHLKGLGVFDWCLLVSVKHMVIRNQGEAVWLEMETKLRTVARRLLFLEYDENDEGGVA
jgi:SAM-dependent methyltransferase